MSLTRSQADAVKAAASEAKTADGQTYYTGSLKICARNAVGLYGGSYNMSDFSSWGVPGDLSLKPELTAPGGSILSVNGEVKDTDQYFLMSGTSMAAPQVTGLTALLMQYFRETGLAEKAGVSPRVLAHSLLMSTAQPLYEEASGGYYSLLKQGAGLAKVDDALAAQAYVLVDGQSDGKVKAELGDDPDRTGSYNFSFTLHNLTDSPLSYVLRTDLFTQDVFEDNGYRYLDTQTRALAVDAGFTSGGNPVLSGDDVLVYDLNGDGKTNQQDADFLLEYLLGNETKLNADGDINGDGKVNIIDLMQIAQYIVGVEGASGADVNGDGKMNILDLMLVAQYIVGVDADSTTTTTTTTFATTESETLPTIETTKISYEPEETTTTSITEETTAQVSYETTEEDTTTIE